MVKGGSFRWLLGWLKGGSLVYVITWGRVELLKDKFHLYFQSFHKIARVAKQQGQFVKTLKIQVKFIINSVRTQCDYLFITQRAIFSENSQCTLKQNQPAPRIKVSAHKQFTTQAV